LALDSGVANAMRFAGIDLETAIRMAVHHPASLLGIQPGGLEVGDPADLVQFHLTDPDGQGQTSGFQAICTVIGGEAAWGRPWPGLFTDVERG
jgi:cytosine/adenosine deaminase-related metal-dependent hydrolase